MEGPRSLLRRWRSVAKIVVMLALFGYLLALVDLRQLGRVLVSVPTSYLLAGAVFNLVNVIIAAVTWSLTLASHGTVVGVARLVRISLVGAFFNNFAPGSVGGDIARVAGLAGHGHDRVIAVLSVVEARLSNLFANLVLGCIGVLIVRPVLGHWLAAALAGCALATLIAIVALTTPSVGAAARFRRLWLATVGKVSRLPDERTVRSSPRLIALAVVPSFAFHLVAVAYVYTLARGIGIDVTFMYFVALVPLITISAQIPITPNGWGVLQNASVFFFSLVGVGAAQSLGLSLLMGLYGLGFGLVGGVLYLRRTLG